jgi:pyridoxal phosphate enzyme (YggS family)
VIDAGAVSGHLDRVRERIARAGGRDVRIVCVTKGFGPEALDAVRATGEVAIGESYAQELRAKADALAGLEVHFIGRLQTNKIRTLAPLVQCWQSVDRVAVAAEIARRAPGAAVLIQVNVSDEPAKGGCEPALVAAMVRAATDAGLNVQGLMAVGRTGEPVDAVDGFRLLRRLTDELALPVCSMGMTADLDVAVSCGSTMVRVGSALFGERPR